jgi:hypothetical protein
MNRCQLKSNLSQHMIALPSLIMNERQPLLIRMIDKVIFKIVERDILLFRKEKR